MEKNLVLTCFFVYLYLTIYGTRIVTLETRNLLLAMQSKVFFTLKGIEETRKRLIKSSVAQGLAISMWFFASYFDIANFKVYMVAAVGSLILIGGSLAEVWYLYIQVFRIFHRFRK